MINLDAPVEIKAGQCIEIKIAFVPSVRWDPVKTANAGSFEVITASTNNLTRRIR